eukprot:scaffold12929_cov21-Tisochrysis_lutea.AAC.4
MSSALAAAQWQALDWDMRKIDRKPLTTTVPPHARVMDRERACEASARDAAALRTTQLQLSTANSKLHEVILRERNQEALARERALEACREALAWERSFEACRLGAGLRVCLRAAKQAVVYQYLSA